MGTIGWTIYFIALAGVLGFMFMRRSGQVSMKEASDYVRRGAMIIDVRTPEEYRAKHLSQSFNMPVDEVESLLPNKVRDKERIILVHCQSGLRSRKAKEQLTRIGYKNVYDMGSYERAFKIVTGKTL
ncbi:MAG TPA: rhodanese-like domain-containing protein [Terracidiphilus sp.]|jgi:phage shock protein E|nr:rhodanese-like domain-containing protein [Terracidiphilus sp.]